MPFIGSIIPANVSGIDRQRKASKREEPRKAGEASAFQRAMDEAELSSVEAAEATVHPHSVKRADAEESREDRTRRGYYGPGGPVAPATPERPRLDTEG